MLREGLRDRKIRTKKENTVTRRLSDFRLSRWNWPPAWMVCALLFGLLSSAIATPQLKPIAARSTLRIYLARHGQTDWNLEGRTQGGTDTPLNDTGRRQAQDLKTRLTGIQL